MKFYLPNIKTTLLSLTMMGFSARAETCSNPFSYEIAKKAKQQVSADFRSRPGVSAVGVENCPTEDHNSSTKCGVMISFVDARSESEFAEWVRPALVEGRIPVKSDDALSFLVPVCSQVTGDITPRSNQYIEN